MTSRLDGLTDPSTPLVKQAVVVAVGGAVVGSLTSFGQAILPLALSPLANSAGAWSLAAFLLASVTGSARRGAILGAIALATMLVGYAITTQLRGFAVGPALLAFWGLAAVVVGPALGVGAAWARGNNQARGAAGVALIAGVLIGEGVYGLTVIAATTPAPYWVGQILVGLAIIAVASMRWPGRGRFIATCVALTAPVAAAFYVAYTADLLALF